MAKREEILVDAVENLLRIRNECSCVVFGECGHADLTVKQVACLKLIDREGDITFSRLAEITRTSPPTVTEMVNRLVRLGYLEKCPCPEDGRAVYVTATPKALAFRDDFDAISGELRNVILAGFSDEEATNLASLLERAAENFN